MTWYYPSYHLFDAHKADSLLNSIAQLQKQWSLTPINIRYYFADTKDEIMHLRGFDYSMDMGNRDKPSGISDDVDNLVYCVGWGENYFHETVHIYLNHVYPQSPLREGLAVFYGGTTGHDIDWHLHRIRQYLAAHPETDLGQWQMWYMDHYTNPASVIKGLICREIYNKEGIKGLKRLMLYTSFDDIFLKEFNVKPGGQSSFLRQLIEAG